MDIEKQLADDLKECAAVLAGEASTGSDQFERYRGDPKALVCSVLGSVAKWISSPRGGNNGDMANELNRFSANLSGDTIFTKP